MATKGLKTEIQQIRTDEICENISDNIISITESKARIVYGNYTNRTTINAILSDLGLAIAFITPIITSDFKSIFGISAEIIKALFILASIIFVIRFVRSVILFIKSGRYLNEDNFIRELKGQERENSRKKKEKIEKKVKQAFREGYLLGRKRR